MAICEIVFFGSISVGVGVGEKNDILAIYNKLNIREVGVIVEEIFIAVIIIYSVLFRINQPKALINR